MSSIKGQGVVLAFLFVFGLFGNLVLATPVSSSTSIPYLSLSVQLANKVHTHMLDPATGAYFYSVSNDWTKVTSAFYNTLGNAFIIDGLIQLYGATGNSTYLLWASHAANVFWKNAWDPANGGFYDGYNTNWGRVTCSLSLQSNAMFEIEFLNLRAANGSSVWTQRANTLANLISVRYWDSAAGVTEVSYDACAKVLSGDVHIEGSVGSYLWAISQWTESTGNTTFVGKMESVANFAWSNLWDGASNTLPGGPNSVGCISGGYLGFMRSVYANLAGLKDCRKGANEVAWGAVGLAYLYNATGNQAYKSYAQQALGWVNNTLWDASKGGFHQNTFRNNVLRSACAHTNDPRDYPGWTEGEQPWLWWSIGQLLGASTYERWALVSEQWTATHQWNSGGTGGNLTCLDGSTVPDSGSVNLYDWIQGSALHTYSALISTGTVTTTSLTGSTTLMTSTPPASTTISTTSLGTTTLHTTSPTSTIATSSSLTTTSITTTTASSSTITTSNTGSLAIDGQGQNGCSSPSLSSCSVVLSTQKSNDVIMLFTVRASGSSGYTISDSAGLNWNVRAIGGSPPARLTVYYAIAPNPLSSDVIQAKLASSGSETLQMIVFGVSGADTGNPFDPGAQKECYTWGNIAQAGTMSCSITTVNANDMLVGFSEEVQAGGVTSGPEYTTITSIRSSGMGISEYSTRSVAGLCSIAFVNSASSSQTMLVTGDAIMAAV